MPAAPMLAAVAVIEIAMICPMDSAIPFTWATTMVMVMIMMIC